MQNIGSKKECEEAAHFLGLKDTTAYTGQSSANAGKPYGCIYADNDWLQWNGYGEKASCGSLNLGSYYSCICVASGMQKNVTIQ